ncbi:MAG: hypothetical protein M1821_009298 [Bathelium mastoideum]|nr:MAG: hypothetical protein M1821_009298 [Bathelium mastoideum]
MSLSTLNVAPRSSGSPPRSFLSFSGEIRNCIYDFVAASTPGEQVDVDAVANFAQTCRQVKAEFLTVVMKRDIVFAFPTPLGNGSMKNSTASFTQFMNLLSPEQKQKLTSQPVKFKGSADNYSLRDFPKLVECAFHGVSRIRIEYLAGDWTLKDVLSRHLEKSGADTSSEVDSREALIQCARLVRKCVAWDIGMRILSRELADKHWEISVEYERIAEKETIAFVTMEWKAEPRVLSHTTQGNRTGSLSDWSSSGIGPCRKK